MIAHAEGKARPVPTRVIVLGASTVAELAVVRGLASAGYEPWLITWSADGPAAHTRANRRVIEVPAPSRKPQELVRQLASIVSRIEADVVLPGTEAALLLLSECADTLGEGIAVGSPPRPIVQRATDKWDVNEAAVRSGLEVPPTVRARSGAASELRSPAVVKPVRSEHPGPNGMLEHLGVRRVDDEEELRTAITRLPAEALVQPFLEAPIRTVNGVAWEGELVAAVHQRAERIWPPDCGMLSAAHTIPADAELERRCGRLLADLRWSGMFNLQFLAQDGTPLLIDLNPRPYQSLALAIAAGVNLPAIWVDLLLARSPRLGPYEVGVRWRYVRDDLLSLGAEARSGRWQQAVRGLLPRHNTVDAVRSWRDPLPIVSVARQELRRVGRRLRKHGSRRGLGADRSGETS